MQIQQGDILIKTTKTGREQLWISQRLVVVELNNSDGLLRKNRTKYKNSVPACDLAKSKEFLPDSGKAWRWGKNRHGYYYCYDNIPDRKPTYYRSKLGTEQELKDALNALKGRQKDSLKEYAKREMLLNALSAVKNTDIRYYMYDADFLFSQQEAKSMAEAVSWCRYLTEKVKNKQIIDLGIRKIEDFYTYAAELISARNLKGLRTKTAASLRNKLKKFPTDEKEQLDYIISLKEGNSNARIVGKTTMVDMYTGEIVNIDVHGALIFCGYMNPGAPQKESMKVLYEDFYVPEITDLGFEPIAPRTFTGYISSINNSIKMSKERDGEDYYKKHILTYIPSKKMEYAHSLIAGDGSGLISYKYINKKGELSSKKLYAMLISDVASRKIIGWSIAPQGQSSENPQMTKEAVKMAMKTCDFKTMHEFVSDNHGAFSSDESKDFLNLVFERTHFIEVKNSQANPAELQFRLFKKTLKRFYNFVSSSWGAGISNKTNEDYIDIDKFPDYKGAIAQLEQIIDEWNNKKMKDGKSPNELFQIKHPENKNIDERIIRRVFGTHTKSELRRMRGIIKVSTEKKYEARKDYHFEIPYYGTTGIEKIAKACGYQKYANLNIVWTPEALDLYTKDMKYIMTCPPAPKSAKAKAEMTEENSKALGHHKQRKLEQSEAADAFVAEKLQELAVIKNTSPDKIWGNLIGVNDYNSYMAMGGNKESYNDAMEEAENARITSDKNKKSKILSKKERAKRDYEKLQRKLAATLEEN